ncbi:MAG: exodeoxyribonuclease VII small subunit [Erythrobacter sp.]
MDEGNASASRDVSASQGQPIADMSFEQALAALEDIVQQLERGDVPLDQSIELYERGEKLRAACQQRLDTAQARIEKIVAGTDGKPAGTAPLDGAD